MTTSPITLITGTTSVSGGTVVNSGSDSILSKGVCYSTSVNPSIADQVILGGAGGGSFVSSLFNLTANQTYYIRAFATIQSGTIYGNQLTFRTDGSIPTTTIDSARAVYVVGSDSLYSVNAVNGNPNWKRSIGPNYSMFSGGGGRLYLGTTQSQLLCYDTSGSVKWSVATNGIPKTSISTNEMVYITTVNGIFAYDTNNGSLKWQKLFTGIYFLNIVLDSPTILYSIISSTVAQIGSLDRQTGNLNWSATGGSGTKLAFDNNRIYAFDYNSGVLNTFSKTNGGLLNSSSTQYLSSDSRLVYNNSILYFVVEDASANQRLNAVDVNTLATRWSVVRSLLNGITRYPIFSDGNLYVAGYDVTHRFNPLTGESINTVGIPAYINVNVTIINGQIFTASRNSTAGFGALGTISCYNTQTANLVWTSSNRANFRTTPCVLTKSGKMYCGGDVY